jgi:outer membrane protein OmpA-like peptidoglycan-associated protein
MKANPNAHLRLEGYTDSTGTPAANQSLSQQRAMAVANYLKGQGIDGSRLTGGGFGQAQPAATNATDAGKADNRRVELFSQQ